MHQPVLANEALLRLLLRIEYFKFFRQMMAIEYFEFFRQMMAAIRIIERHYSRHARVVPSQLFVDKERMQPADWGELTFPSAAVT